MMRTSKRNRLLADLRQQSAEVRFSRDWSRAKDLAALLDHLKRARPRARSIRFRGARFPLAWSLSCTAVLCPATGQPLVASVDL